MPFDADVRVDSAKELLEALLENELFAPRNLSDVTDIGTCGFVFRGQANAEWPLLPSAHRPGNPLSKFTSNSPGDHKFPGDSERLNLGRLVHAEIRAVIQFLEQADHTGLATPLDYAGFDVHQPLLDALFGEKVIFDHTAHPFPSRSLLPSFAFAQHYGVPTRLLDWTESALKASYFAAIGVCKSLNGTVDSEEIGILALDTRWFRKHHVEIVRAPRHPNSNLLAQEGVFTMVSHANLFRLSEGRWPSLEEVAKRAAAGESRNVRSSLVRLRLPSGEADQLLRLLYRYRITRHHLHPTLANAATSYAYKQALWPKLT